MKLPKKGIISEVVAEILSFGVNKKPGHRIRPG